MSDYEDAIRESDDGWPETRADAADLLDTFEREAWPVYERRGFTFPQAILTHLLPAMSEKLDTVAFWVFTRAERLCTSTRHRYCRHIMACRPVVWAAKRIAS